MQPNIGQQEVTSVDLSIYKDSIVSMATPKSQGPGIVTLEKWVSNMN